MAEFAYHNAKNASTGHTLFELNCGNHPRVSFEEDTDPRSQSKTADELSAELQELMTVCRKNLHHTQELQKRAHNKGVKPRSYAPSDKVWLNRQYIKTKRNRKLEAKFFGPFRVLHQVGKQAYKLELLKRWKIHDVFHMSLLEEDTTRKERVEKVPELDAGDNSEEYEVEAIRDSAVYAEESESGQLPGLYYLVAWKRYPEEENTWEPSSAVYIAFISGTKLVVIYFELRWVEKWASLGFSLFERLNGGGVCGFPLCALALRWHDSEAMAAVT